MDSFSLTLIGRTKPIPVSELLAEQSRHTSRALRRIQLDFTVAGEESNDTAVKELNDARAADNSLEGDGRRWVVTGHNWNYAAGGEEYKHQVELTELETLNPTRLEFAGLSFAPDRYSEDIVEGRIMICVIVTPDGDSDQSLEMLIRSHIDEVDAVYFPLRRIGVSDDEISVRFGRCLRERPSRGRRHQIVFVQEGDSDPQGGFAQINQPNLARTEETAAAGHRAIVALVVELQAVGTLSEDAGLRVIEALRTDNLGSEHRRRFNEADDLDSYFMD